MLTHFSISQQGEKHIEKNIPCQDYSESKKIKIKRFDSEMIIAAIADGVGSCEYSQYGSKNAVESFLSCVEFNLQNTVSELSDEKIFKVIEHAFNYALSQVMKESQEKELPFVEFDTTLTGTIYDGHTLWYGHIGDGGLVVLYIDGQYEMITKRHKGEEANMVMPLRETDLWQFGKSNREVSSYVLMTDGILDYCVDHENMSNRVYYPFLKPALVDFMDSEEDVIKRRLDWDEYLAGKGDYDIDFRKKVSDDISLVVVQNSDLLKITPILKFDLIKWNKETIKRKKELDDILYADYRAYKARIYQDTIAKNNEYENSIVNDDLNKNTHFENNDAIVGICSPFKQLITYLKKYIFLLSKENHDKDTGANVCVINHDVKSITLKNEEENNINIDVKNK